MNRQEALSALAAMYSDDEIPEDAVTLEDVMDVWNCGRRTAQTRMETRVRNGEYEKGKAYRTDAGGRRVQVNVYWKADG